MLSHVVDDPNVHRAAAVRHDQAAETHARLATFWHEQGDEERALLQSELADYERAGATLERRWAEIVERDHTSG